MFGKKKIKEDMIPKLSFSSKTMLKKEALLLSKGDIEQATKFYDFLIKDMEDLPTFDVVKPSTFEQIKDTAGNVFAWAKENKDDIISVMDWIKSLKGNKGNVNTPNLPPSNPLPKI